MTFPDFPTYFHALWGFPPFPWQARLASTLQNGNWPSWITLPTGMGKTAVLDIAIYDLARQASLPSEERTAPVRIVFAVNRRIIVDEAFQRSRHIGRSLRTAAADPEDILYPVAISLRNLSGLEDEDPLKTYPLRGGTFTDHSWAKTPTQPIVLTTTLDQLGSRLLFRGYGVSEFARPIHAALLANDSLLILDEAHTAKAFSQTLSAIADFKKQVTENVTRPFHCVQLTATPPESATHPFQLDDQDYANGTIARRYNASKPTTLKLVENATGITKRHSELSSAISKEALELITEHRRLLIVVNRIATAEALLNELKKKPNVKKHQAAVKLLTGRIRPLDRDSLLNKLSSDHQLNSREPASNVARLILIATQTIEVGADYDFDALLSELAPLDSLRQRFGRLNRQGRKIPAPAVIFAPGDALDEKKPDPLYGTCLPLVWKWLQDNLSTQDDIDFGLRAMAAILPRGQALTPLLAPSPDAPILLAPHLDLLCQTSPEPHVSPDPAIYIHGPGIDFPQIPVVIRADLAGGEPFIETAPPLGAEAATIPLHLVRNWLGNPLGAKDQSGDSPGEISDEPKSDKTAEVTGAYIYRSGDTIPVKYPNQVTSGDILVIPATADHIGNLIPLPHISDPDPWLLDHYEEAYLNSRDRFHLRFHPEIITRLTAPLPTETNGQDNPREQFSQLINGLLNPTEEGTLAPFIESAWRKAIPKIASILANHLPEDHPSKKIWLRAHTTREGKPRPASDWKVAPYPGKGFTGVIFLNRSRVGFTNWPLDPADLGRQRDTASSETTLEKHSADVSRRAAANAAGLKPELVTTLRDSGLWHDLGKLDPRFQALLRGSSPTLVLGPPLAKSAGYRPPSVAKFYRELSELPEGFRHELLSTLIVATSQAVADHPEHALLLHLIASHHGRCRAMAPVTHDSQPLSFDAPVAKETVTYPGNPHPLAHIASGVTSRFWSLNRRFGWWGLPYLETLLRLADQRESANPSPKQNP